MANAPTYRGDSFVLNRQSESLISGVVWGTDNRISRIQLKKLPRRIPDFTIVHRITGTVIRYDPLSDLIFTGDGGWYKSRPYFIEGQIERSTRACTYLHRGWNQL